MDALEDKLSWTDENAQQRVRDNFISSVKTEPEVYTKQELIDSFYL